MSKEYKYRTKGTCSSEIRFEIDDDNKIRNVSFTGGCNGNLKALAKLVEGMPCEEVIEKLSGIECGVRGTSCADQLTKAIKQASENL